MTKGNEYLRKLTTERIYYGRPMTYVVMMARITGKITKDQLLTSIDKLIKKHQLLKSKIVIDNKNKAFFSQKEVKDFDIKEIDKNDHKQWQQIAKEEHMKFFDTSIGPLIRFTLLQSSEDTDLVICAHHSISDGLSLVELVQDIMVCLNNEECIIQQKSVLPEINEKLLGGKIGNLKNRTLLKMINALWRRKNVLFTFEDIKKLHERFWEVNKGVKVIGWKIPKQNSIKIMEKAKKHGITVHSLLVAVFLKAQKEIQIEKEKCHEILHMPVDMRKRLQLDKRMGFCAVALILNHQYNEDEGFWKEVKRIHEKIRKEMGTADLTRLYTINLFEPTLLDSTYAQVYGLFESRISKLIVNAMGINQKIAGTAITNLGKLELENSINNKYQLLEIYGPSVYSELLEKVVSVLTFNNEMYLTMTIETAIIDEKIAIQVKERAMKILNDEFF